MIYNPSDFTQPFTFSLEFLPFTNSQSLFR